MSMLFTRDDCMTINLFFYEVMTGMWTLVKLRVCIQPDSMSNNQSGTDTYYLKINWLQYVKLPV